MLRFFNNNQLHTALFVILSALPFLFAQFYHQDDTAIVEPQFYEYINQNQSFAFAIFALILFVQAFWLNNLINFYRIGKRTSYYTAIIFLLLIVSFDVGKAVSPSLFSNLLIIAALQQFFKVYDNKNTVKEVFNAAFLCSMAVIFNPETVLYLFFAVAAWLKVRTFNLKEFVILLFGITAPFYLIGTYMYLNNNLLSWLSYLVGHFGRISSTIEPDLFFWIVVPGIGFLGIISVLNYGAIKAKTNIREQKYIDLLFFLLFFSGLFWIMNNDIDIDSLRMMALPLSIFISLNLQAIKNQKLSELQFFMLLIMVILANYGGQIFKLLGF
jgi:hypothetical protein